jgi:hypothetical protein
MGRVARRARQRVGEPPPSPDLGSTALVYSTTDQEGDTVTILTDAGKDHVDATEKAVEEIEEQVRERIEDAIRALTIWDNFWEGENSVHTWGKYVNRDDVLEAVKRGNW